VLRLETNRNYIIQCGKPFAFHKKKFLSTVKAFDLGDFLKSLLNSILGGVSLLFGVSVSNCV
jgi:hypothetical protein